MTEGLIFKKTRRIFYKTKQGTNLFLKEIIEAFSYFLWLSVSPLSIKLFADTFGDWVSVRNIRADLNNFCKRGFISKIKKKRQVFYYLKKSPFGLFGKESRHLKEDMHKKKWNGYWWILIYDIPEKIRLKRNNLRIFLKELGFGKLQESSWISPYDFSGQIHKFCYSLKILKYICLYEAKFFSGKSIPKLAEEVWGLNNMDSQYQYLINRCEKEIEILATQEVDLKDYMGNYVDLYKEYKETIEKDPFLPKKFLKKWKREKSLATFNKLSRLIYKRINFMQKPNL